MISQQNILWHLNLQQPNPRLGNSGALVGEASPGKAASDAELRSNTPGLVPPGKQTNKQTTTMTTTMTTTITIAMTVTKSSTRTVETRTTTTNTRTATIMTFIMIAIAIAISIAIAKELPTDKKTDGQALLYQSVSGKLKKSDVIVVDYVFCQPSCQVWACWPIATPRTRSEGTPWAWL